MQQLTHEMFMSFPKDDGTSFSVGLRLSTFWLYRLVLTANVLNGSCPRSRFQIPGLRAAADLRGIDLCGSRPHWSDMQAQSPRAIPGTRSWFRDRMSRAGSSRITCRIMRLPIPGKKELGIPSALPYISTEPGD